MHWLLPVVAVACAASLGAFVAMRAEKRRAQRGHRRIRERNLAAWALLGGWPGLIAGGVMFRHKTKARGFQLKAALGALVHGVAVVLLWRSGL